MLWKGSRTSLGRELLTGAASWYRLVIEHGLYSVDEYLHEHAHDCVCLGGGNGGLIDHVLRFVSRLVLCF